LGGRNYVLSGFKGLRRFSVPVCTFVVGVWVFVVVIWRDVAIDGVFIAMVCEAFSHYPQVSISISESAMERLHF
jgi:hypothetical protein